MNWHELSEYYQGKNEEGHEMLHIPLEPDEDGMVGRECSQEECEPKYFKIAPREVTKDDNFESWPDTLYCPYCGFQNGIQQFTTQDQIEWMKSLIFRDMAIEFQNLFKKSFGTTKPPSRNSMISFNLIYKPGRLPDVRHYAEKELKNTVKCDECGGKYAVYGISLYCPVCGKGSIQLHLSRSIEIIDCLLDVDEQIEEIAGKDASLHLLGNCLEDSISLFEGFLKVIYSKALLGNCDVNERDKKLRKLRNAFQNLSKAEEILRSDLEYELFEDVSPSDQDFMKLQFAKRHVITHNLVLYQ